MYINWTTEGEYIVTLRDCARRAGHRMFTARELSTRKVVHVLGGMGPTGTYWGWYSGGTELVEFLPDNDNWQLLAEY